MEINSELSHNSVDIYKGSLNEIDDFSKFSILFETTEPAYFFKDLDGVYVFCGQRGELAFGFNGGTEWRKGRIDIALRRNQGRTYDFYVVSEYLIKINR